MTPSTHDEADILDTLFASAAEWLVSRGAPVDATAVIELGAPVRVGVSRSTGIEWLAVDDDAAAVCTAAAPWIEQAMLQLAEAQIEAANGAIGRGCRLQCVLHPDREAVLQVAAPDGATVVLVTQQRVPAWH